MRNSQVLSSPAQKRAHSQMLDNSETTASPAAKRGRGGNGNSTSIDLSGGTIEVAVSGGETFHIHKNLICKSSPFFTNATKPEWAGSTPKPVELSDVSSAVFKIYMAYLYAKDLDGVRDPDQSWTLLADSYVLGEIVMDTIFQQAIVDEMVREIKDTEHFPGVTAINTIYNGTMPASPVRRLIVDLCASRANQETFKNDTAGITQLHTEFLQDTVRALLDQRPPLKSKKGEGPWSKNPKAYDIKVSKH